MNRKIQNFFNSLDTLHEAAHTDYTQSKILLSGCVNTFNLTFELAWKAMKYILTYEGVDASHTGSPKLILEAAYQRGLIQDEEAWIHLMRMRNDESHHYNEEAAQDLCRKIPDLLRYFDDLKTEITSLGYADQEITDR